MKVWQEDEEALPSTPPQKSSTGAHPWTQLFCCLI